MERLEEVMKHPEALDESARHLVFLTAAWIANVDGQEHGAEIDALCQLRNALGIAPLVARRLLDIARRAPVAPTLAAVA
ncbi:MAG: hypothetical protein AAF997_02875 [Myxococcota bacterium]